MTKKVALLTSMLMFVIMINNLQVIFLSELNIQLEVQNNQNLTDLNPPKLCSTPLWNYSTDSNALSVAISANGRYIVTGSQNHMVYFFENSSSQPLWVNCSAGSTLAMSSDGKYIVTIGGIGKEIFLFNRSSSTPLWIYPANIWIYRLAISSDGNYIIAGGESAGGSNVYFFNVTKTMDPLIWSYGPIGKVRSVVISSNGSYIAVGGDDYNIYLFNKSSSTPMQVWSTSGDVDSIAISSNGEYIVAGSRDHNVYLFNRSSSTPIWSYTTRGLVTSVAISSDGNHIVAGGTDHKVYFFDKSSSTPLWNYTTGDVRSVASHLHIDLCTFIKRSFIVPNQSYKLKDLGALFKYPFKHTHLDGFAAALKYLTHIEKGEPLEQEVLEYGEDDVKVLPFLIETIKKGEGIIKKKFSDLTSLDSPIELIGDKNELTVKVRDFYEEHGSLSIRKDKRYNSFKTEIRFYGKKLKDLDFIRNAMVTLSFGEGSPYQYPSSTRCYVPYYGKDQVIRFIKTIKPRKNNDISRLTT